MSDSQSSDEKMLRLIQGKSRSDDSGDEKVLKLVAQKKDPQNISDYEKDILSSKEEGDAKKQNAMLDALKKVNLQVINLLLIAIIAIGILFIMIQYGLFLGKLSDDQLVFTDSSSSKSGSPLKEQGFQEQELLGIVSARNIFREGRHSLIERKQGGSPSDPRPALDEINLVGIIWSERKPQAIVENIATNETVFVTEGDAVANGTIKKIMKESFILEYNGGEYVVE